MRRVANRSVSGLAAMSALLATLCLHGVAVFRGLSAQPLDIGVAAFATLVVLVVAATFTNGTALWMALLVVTAAVGVLDVAESPVERRGDPGPLPTYWIVAFVLPAFTLSLATQTVARAFRRFAAEQRAHDPLRGSTLRADEE